MKNVIIHGLLGIIVLVASTWTVCSWLKAADARAKVAFSEEKKEVAAVAAAADEDFCTPDLRVILKRVLTSCGIAKEVGGRGCKPLDAANVAAMSGGDFNALFKPMAERASIIQFDMNSSTLDDAAKAMIDNSFADRRGASYFLIVSRASPEGSVDANRELSEKRASALYDHLKELQKPIKDSDFDQVAGMLWLGEEFAQLEEEFCGWNRSRPDAPCTANELNRSAFVTWIDCRL